MIICEDFIVLNFPRTGSTFVRVVIKKVLNNRNKNSFILKTAQLLRIVKAPYIELFLPNYHSPNKLTRIGKGQHGAYCQIPAKYKNKAIVTVIRNPYDIFLSTYRMAWWQSFYPIKKEELYNLFPDFPSLTIDEYVELLKLSVDNKTSTNIGIHTVQFIRMFFKDPERVLNNITEDYIESDLYKEDLADNIKFLTQENLNNDLANYLSIYNFTDEEISFVRKYERVNISIKKNGVVNKIWSENSLQYVQESERFLFKIFNDLGINYSKPIIPV